MLNVFLVALREAVETLLLLVATAAYLPSSRHGSLLLRLAGGALVGTAAGVQAAVWMSRVLNPLAHALMTLAFGIFLAWMAAGTLTSNGRIGRWIRDRVDLWAERLGWPVAVFLVAAVVTFREAFELGFYAMHQAKLVGWGDTAVGVAGGLAAAALLPFLLFLLDLRSHLALVFRISALLLSWLALRMVVSGLVELAHLAGWIEHDGGAIGSRLSESLLMAMLMLVPIYFIVRDWWTEAEDPVERQAERPEEPPPR